MNTKKNSASTNQNPNSPFQQPETGDQKPLAGNQYRASSIQHRTSGIALPASSPRPFIIPIFIPHAGCPHQCVFCNQVSITGAKQKMATPAELRFQIHEFLKYKKENRKPVQIAFFGGNFLGLKSEKIKSLLDSAAEFVRDGQVDGIRFSTRPDTINQQSLDIIKDYPVSTVELGVQSMDDQVLALAGRGHSASDTVRAVEQLKERHFSIGLQMMVGLPGDDEAGALTTAQRIADLGPDFVRIYPTLVVANSRLAGWYKNGDYAPLSLEEGVTPGKKNLSEIYKGGHRCHPHGAAGFRGSCRRNHRFGGAPSSGLRSYGLLRNLFGRRLCGDKICQFDCGKRCHFRQSAPYFHHAGIEKFKYCAIKRAVRAR